MNQAGKQGGPGLPEDFYVHVHSRCDVPSEPTSISGTRALHGQPRQTWVTDTPRMNPVQRRGMGACGAVAGPRRSGKPRDGQPFSKNLKKP